MKTEVIKPNGKRSEGKNILTPIMYLIIGIMLAFKSNEVITILFYVIGVLVIVYGIKALITYYQNKALPQFKKIQLSIGIISIMIGLLLIVLADVLEASMRFILGFFLIYMGVSRLLSEISFGDYKNYSTLSNIVLIILGIYSIFVSSAVFVIIGWVLIANSVLLFWDYLKKG